MRKIFILAIVGVLILPSSAFSFWIWSPKTGKWTNPKYAPKSSPAQQLEWALGFYNEKNFKQAKLEFQKLLKHYPRAKEAAEAQYYLGLILREQGSLYAAYEALQKVIDKYPFSPRINEIIEQELKIAQRFIEGHRRKFAGVALPVENPAIEVLQRVIENSTYGVLAPIAQYKLGLVLKAEDRFFEAQEAFEKVVSNYSDSEWLEPARFQIARCQAQTSLGSDYDQVATAQAKKKFEEFLKTHPDAQLSKEAENFIEELQQKEAEGLYNTAVFYGKQKAYNAARVYYEAIIKDYSDTDWSAKALVQIENMEKEDEKH
ncbi:MAG: tetratricopeptide repeat protein [Candidatus Omnitrophica bacterium]|nr:tetratricopeptide repeat protein [Candidatus Omnitrophota bacterium]